MIGGLGSTEIMVIAIVMVLLFGASRIPELGRSLGTGIREFKNGLRSVANDDDEEDKKKIEQAEDV